MTYNEETATVEPRDADEWLDIILKAGTDYWGEEITERDNTSIHHFYDPFAQQLAEIEEELEQVINALRIQTAEGRALDMQGEKLGVERIDAAKATGRVTFRRSDPATKDYLIKEKTEVKTTGISPVYFTTTEKTTIEGPETKSDSTNYSTDSTSYVTKVSFTADVTSRESLDVSADLKTSDSTYAADIEIADSTNSTVIKSTSTTNTTFTGIGPSSYDVSDLSGDITIEYAIKIGDSAAKAEMDNATLELGGETEAVADIRAKEVGTQGNVAVDAIDEATPQPTGVQTVTNKSPTEGGREREIDDSYRRRIKNAVGDIESVSGYHIYNTLSLRDFVRSIRFIDNSSDFENNNLDPHKAEVIVDAVQGHRDEIAQTIFKNSPMGVDLVGGVHGDKKTGTATLPNGQEFTIPYSTPTEVSIYIDADVSQKDSIDKASIKNRIVEYIGGTKVNGVNVYGELKTSEDVLYGEVEYAIRDVEGIYDVQSLEIGTSPTPSGTSDIDIAQSERATIDAADISITI